MSPAPGVSTRSPGAPGGPFLPGAPRRGCAGFAADAAFSGGQGGVPFLPSLGSGDRETQRTCPLGPTLTPVPHWWGCFCPRADLGEQRRWVSRSLQGPSHTPAPGPLCPLCPRPPRPLGSPPPGLECCPAADLPFTCRAEGASTRSLPAHSRQGQPSDNTILSFNCELVIYNNILTQRPGNYLCFSNCASISWSLGSWLPGAARGPP